MTYPYTFGSFLLHNPSAGYLLTGKELNLPIVKPHTAPIARREGMKKSGEQVDSRTVTATVKVVGISRLDLISKIDALQQALSLRGQALCLHEDGRFYKNVDAIGAPVKFQAGHGIVQCEIAIAFTAYDPFAYAVTNNSYDTGSVALTLSGSSWAFSTISLSDSGTVYSLPFIRIYNRSSTGSTTLSAGLTSGTSYTSISVNATTFSASVGDQLTLTDGGSNTQTLTVATAFSAGATTISVNSFTAATSYASGDSVTKITQWTNLAIAQMPDSLALSCNSSVGAALPALNGDYVDIQCDPSVFNGYTIQTNSNGQLIEPLGLFPVIEPGTTTFTISIQCASAVTAEAVFTWTSRYMS
jgi:hypothetical protein